MRTLNTQRNQEAKAFSAVVVLLLLASTGAADPAPADEQQGKGSNATASAAPSGASTGSNLSGTTIHLYYIVSGYTDLAPGSAQVYCSAPRTQLRVGDDDGTTLTVAVDKVSAKGKDEVKPGSTCAANLVSPKQQYKIAKNSVVTADPTIQGFVSGVLAVPFKYHVSDRALTAGSTVGGYVGYRTSVANQFAITPVLAGGLALISTVPAQVASSSQAPATQSSATQTSAGVSVATGFIGSVTSSSSKGAQYGILVGVDWLGKNAKYAYEGKPWVAFEIGYNFAL